MYRFRQRTSNPNSRTLSYALAGSHFLQWVSAVIVMSIVSYYIHKYDAGRSLIYEEVIATTTTAFYLISFVAPVWDKYKSYYLPLDFIFSYLWLTSFIFTAQDYNQNSCRANAPPGARDCGLKHTSEAFCFLAFFFTLTSLILEVLVWKKRTLGEGSVERAVEPKDRPSADTNATSGATTV